MRQSSLGANMLVRFKLELDKVLILESSHTPLILLEDVEGKGLWLPITVGMLEMGAIVSGLEKLRSTRPMTYDLIQSAITELGGTIESVVITRFENQVYFAELHLRKPDGKISHIDSRPSDAMALALRLGCPILADEDMFNDLPEILVNTMQDGVEITSKERQTGFYALTDIEKMPTDDLEAMKKIFSKLNKPPDKDKLS